MLFEIIEDSTYNFFIDLNCGELVTNTFEYLQTKMADFVKRRNWNDFHIPKNLAMSISIEAAELMEIFQWMTNQESIEKVSDPTIIQEIKDEIADVIIYILSLANVTGIDLEAAVTDKMARNEIRFPESPN